MYRPDSWPCIRTSFSGEVRVDASAPMDRWAAADLLREACTERFRAAIADGLALRYDGDPCFRSAHYQAEIDHQPSVR